MLLVLGLSAFVLLIVAHEFGHFIAAKRSGVEVEEFGIGFPPRLLAKKYKGTLYSFNLLPLGGFVKLKGEADSDRQPGSFGAASFANKAKILLAGVAINAMVAYVLLFGLALVKLPVLFDGQFTVASDERAITTDLVVLQTAKDSPAGVAGIPAGSIIESIDGAQFATTEELVEFTRARPGEEVTVIWRSNGNIRQADITLASTEEGEGRLGVVPMANQFVRYSWSAPIVAAGITGQTFYLTLKFFGTFLGNLVTDGVSVEGAAGVAGPIGIFKLLQFLDELGLVSYVLALAATISGSLALLNALPIPAIDGGRLTLIAIFRVLKRPLSSQLEGTINTIGFAALIGLGVIVGYLDVVRFF